MEISEENSFVQGHFPTRYLVGFSQDSYEDMLDFGADDIIHDVTRQDEALRSLIKRDKANKKNWNFFKKIKKQKSTKADDICNEVCKRLVDFPLQI